MMDEKREFLRHTLATLAYRGIKAVSGAPEGFAAVRVCATTRTAGEILAHIADLLDWALSMALGEEAWHANPPGSWEAEVERFLAGLGRLDDFLKSGDPLEASAEKLFQGPIADALTHVGQIATLRRLAGSAVRGENYSVAEIVAGRVGTDQAAPRYEFD
jgi:hypothetical protein